MKNKLRIFSDKNTSRGNMLIELLLSIALASVVIPFIFQYQHDATVRAQNISIRNQMSDIQAALERYIIANREQLLQTVGRNITRVDLDALIPFGIPESVLAQGDETYQLRILKTNESGDQATLQGIVVRVSDDVSPLRTREIVNMSGGTMGFVDGTHAYGTFGTWHADLVDLGLNIDNGIIETTRVNRDNALYLWRVPSDNPDDAKMMAALNLSGHDISDASFVNAMHMEFNEFLTVPEIVSNELIFKNRASLDGEFSATSATVSGALSSDAKDMEISGRLIVSDIAKLSSLTSYDLWVNNMTLGGLSIDAPDDLSILKINQSLDMTSGRIEAMFVTVGFAGSMTPRLVVYDKIADSTDSQYYWDVNSKTANFMDATFNELNRMATLASYYESDSATISGQVFGAVSANKNATVSDYMNAINEIQTRVRAKFRQLNLQ